MRVSILRAAGDRPALLATKVRGVVERDLKAECFLRLRSAYPDRRYGLTGFRADYESPPT
jgi:hypothetical protein